jgi:hypothetical protein
MENLKYSYRNQIREKKEFDGIKCPNQIIVYSTIENKLKNTIKDLLLQPIFEHILQTNLTNYQIFLL